MQPYLISILLLIFSAALQGAWPAWLRIGGQAPELVVAAVACIGLSRGAFEGCLAGLIAAVLQGASAHTPLGGLFASFMVVGACTGFLRGSLLSERTEVALGASAGAVLLAGFIRLVFMPPEVFLLWLKGVFQAAIFTVIITPPVFWITRLMHRREPHI